MATLFDRVYRLEVGDSGSTLTVDGFQNEAAQIQFRVEQGTSEFVTRAQITIFGLSRDSRQRIYRQYENVRLVAGYRERYGQIFLGKIYNVGIGRQGPETFIELFCRSSGIEWTEANVVQTFGKGTPMEEVITTAARAFGVTVEKVGDFSYLPKLLNSLPVQEGATSFLRKAAEVFDFTWQFEPGRVVLYAPGAERDTIHKTSAISGMVGTPMIRERGLDVTTRLNSDVRINDFIEVENVTGQLVYNNPDGVRFENSIGKGKYKIIKFTHIGDYYGDQWDTVQEGLNPRVARL